MNLNRWAFASVSVLGLVTLAISRFIAYEAETSLPADERGNESAGSPTAAADGRSTARGATAALLPDLPRTKLFGADDYRAEVDGPCASAGSYLSRHPQVGPDGSVYFIDNIGLRRLTEDCRVVTVQKNTSSVRLFPFAFDRDTGDLYQSFSQTRSGSPSSIFKTSRDGTIEMITGGVCVNMLRNCAGYPIASVTSDKPIHESVAIRQLVVHEGAVYVASPVYGNRNGDLIMRLNSDGSADIIGQAPYSVLGVEVMVIDDDENIYI